MNRIKRKEVKRLQKEKDERTKKQLDSLRLMEKKIIHRIFLGEAEEIAGLFSHSV